MPGFNHCVWPDPFLTFMGHRPSLVMVGCFSTSQRTAIAAASCNSSLFHSLPETALLHRSGKAGNWPLQAELLHRDRNRRAKTRDTNRDP
jgi:hypothetical protein